MERKNKWTKIVGDIEMKVDLSYFLKKLALPISEEEGLRTLLLLTRA